MDERESKEKLIRGAEELFMKYGLRSVSMDDIARHLGISKKTIYQHFADKDEVVATVAQSHMRRQQQQFEDIVKAAKNAVEEMAMFATNMKEHLRNINPALLFEMQKYHTKAWNEWLAFKHNVIRDSIVRSMKEGVADGYFRADFDIGILATMRLEQMQMAFDNTLFPRDKYSISEIQAQLFEHFVHGIMTDKGRKLYEKYKAKTITEYTNP